MKLFLQILLLVTSIALILLILLHRSRGGGLSSLFGGGVQSSLSGSSVVEKNLDRLTLFVSSVWVISIVGTLVILFVVDKLMGLRVSEDAEREGLDLSQHGEEGYDWEAA